MNELEMLRGVNVITKMISMRMVAVDYIIPASGTSTTESSTVSSSSRHYESGERRNTAKCTRGQNPGRALTLSV